MMLQLAGGAAQFRAGFDDQCLQHLADTVRSSLAPTPLAKPSRVPTNASRIVSGIVQRGADIDQIRYQIGTTCSILLMSCSATYWR